MTLSAAITDLMLVLQGALWCVIPHLSRPTIVFGVTVSPGFASSAEKTKILARYSRSVAAVSLVAITVAYAAQLVRPGLTIGACTLFTFLQIAACLFLWVRASGETRGFAAPAASARTVSLKPRNPSLPGGWLFLLGPLLILGIAAWYLQSNWNSIPENFPVHWGIDGQPNRWAIRSIKDVYRPLLIAFLINAIVIGNAYAIIFRTRQVSASGPSADREQASKRGTYVFILTSVYAISILFAGIATRVVWARRPAELGSGFSLMILLPLLVSAACVFYGIRTGQGGTRLVGPYETTPPGDGTPDQYWRLGGQFYFNPDDPALMVEKRVGNGWTFNFGHKICWLFFLLMLLGPPIVIFLTR
jgi:uncharacterized membrane protein